jgi:hypothetical protein
MASFTTVIPTSPQEVFTSLEKLYENRSHVSSVIVDEASRTVRVDLDWAANKMGGVPDFQIPVKAGVLLEAREIVEQLRRRFETGTPVTRDLAERLFQCVDSRR